MPTRIKICGLTSPADAVFAAGAGADMIGLNFYPRSSRFIDETTARDILGEMPARVEAVGLFVNADVEHVRGVTERLALPTIQRHGDHLEPWPTATWRDIVAWPVRDADSLARLDVFLARCERLPAAVLVDAHVPGSYGGTGQAAPWALLADYRCPVPLILAGGLTPANVADAVRQVRPWGVDVASGVESSPGRKDADAVRRFIDAVRSAE